jgi:hypothetical protein
MATTAKKGRREPKAQLRLYAAAEAPADNRAVWLTQLEVEALFGIRKTRFYAMQAFDGRFFRCGKTTQSLLDAFNQTYPDFRERDSYARDRGNRMHGGMMKERMKVEG